MFRTYGSLLLNIYDSNGLKSVATISSRGYASQSRASRDATNQTQLPNNNVAMDFQKPAPGSYRVYVRISRRLRLLVIHNIFKGRH